MNVEAILALIAELYDNLGKAGQRIAQLEQRLAEMQQQQSDDQPERRDE